MRPRAIAPAVELFATRTPTLPPATHTNSLALGGKDVLLVEPAPEDDDERAAWIAWARGIRAEGRALVGILATHHHRDHIGGAAFLARHLGLPLLAHPRTHARMPDLEGVTRLDVDEGATISLDGQTPVRFHVLHTPGHAPGHLCLHEPSLRTLVVGDMVANGSTILIPHDDGGDMAAYVAQLGRLDALGATLMIPAHGEPFDDPHAVLSYYVAHRAMREEKVRRAYETLSSALGRPPTALEIVPIAYDDTPIFAHPIAVGSAEAHLAKLRRERRIE